MPKKLEWPDTTPIDKTDPHWEFNNNANFNGISYRKAEVSPGKWQWVVNEEAMASMRAYENRKRELFWALRTRILSDEEMQEAIEYGENLNIQNMTPYYPAEKSKELNEAYYQQARLRALAPREKV